MFDLLKLKHLFTQASQSALWSLLSFYLLVLSLLVSLGCTPSRGNNQLGDPCNAPNDCVSSLCAQVDGVKQCTQSCSVDQGCPDEYLCFSGYCIVDQTPITSDPQSQSPQSQSECVSIFDCMSMCEEDEECVIDCFLNGTSIGQQTLIQLEDCVSIMCLTLDETCFNQYCSAEYNGCLTDQIVPSAECFSMYTCQLECEDESCENACFLDTRDEYIDDLDSLNLCLDDQASECTEFSCAVNACRSEYQTCYRP